MEAKDAVVDGDALPVLPEFPDDEEADVVAGVATGVVPEGAVVVVVVELVGLDVVVVVDPAAAAVNVTVTVRAVRSMLSVVSCAVYVTGSAVVSLTVKVAMPLLFVVALVAVTLEPPPDAVNVMVFPVTGSPLPS